MIRRRPSDEDYLVGNELFGEEGPDGEPGEAAEGRGQAAARLADGSGFLITDGPGAGSITDDGNGPDIRDASPLPGRDKALAGTLPLFVVQRPARYFKPVPRLLAQLHTAAGDNLGLGISAFMHQASPKSHADFSSQCAAAAVRIIDPAAFIADPGDIRVGKPAARCAAWAPYLAGRPATVADLLDMQRERGANLLLTAGRALDKSEARESVAAACDEADDALAELKPGERLALNFTLTADWLRNKSLRNTLLTELIAREQFGVWHIRVQWPPKTKAWAQPADKEFLTGYRRLAQVAEDEDRRLLLPQTGLTGWLMLAWGAAGFSTGPLGSNQGFLEPSGGRGGNPAVERYFERQLLYTIERTSRRLITGDPGYSQCQCPYCTPLLSPSLFLLLGGAYVYAFRHGTGTIAEPARAVVSVFQPNASDARDLSSNQYRIIEDADLKYTEAQSPLLGYGFGKPFLQPQVLPNVIDLDPYYLFIPHNNVLWVWMRLGPLGFAALWYLFGSAIVTGCMTARRLKNRELQLFAIFAVATLVMEVILAYSDYQFFFYRNMIFTGILMGVLMKLPAIARQTLDETVPDLEERAEPERPKPARPRRRAIATMPIPLLPAAYVSAITAISPIQKIVGPGVESS